MSTPSLSEDAPEPGQDGRPLPERLMIHMPVDVRSISLAVLAVLASMYMLRWASAVLIPVMSGVMLSYALSPIVHGLERLRIPRALSSGVLLASIVGACCSTAYSLADDAAVLVESLPEAARKLQRVMDTGVSSKPGAIDLVQQAARQLEQVAASSAAASVPRGVQRVQIERTRFDIKDYLWTGALGLFGALGQAIMVLFIAFFMLASGDTFRRKLVKLAGPKLSQKKITVQALNEIDVQIQRYLLVQVVTSVIVGVATGLIFMLFGLEHAAVWGVLAAVLNLIPYVGALVVTLASALVALLQFGTIDMVSAVGGSSLVIHGLVGHLLTPWLTSRASKINPVVVFVGVLFWGWLWGIWGLLLGAPILMMIKAVADRIDDLSTVAELLDE